MRQQFLKVIWSLNSNFNKDFNCTENFQVCKILQAELHTVMVFDLAMMVVEHLPV